MATALRSCLSIDDLNDGDIGRLFLYARRNKLEGFRAALGHKIVMTAFFEDSTRTRLSFSLAAERLGLSVVNFEAATSSMKKGESLKATLDNLQALAPDVLIVRQSEPLDRDYFKRATTPIINAGDGMGEHPSQALLDCFTLQEHLGLNGLAGTNILFVGDVAHSRVYHSNRKLMERLGATVYVLSSSDADYSCYDEVPRPMDAVVLLRTQVERHSLQERSKAPVDYCLTSARLHRLGEGCLIMHPGPVMAGVDLAYELMDHPRSLIMEQVRHGVFMRAALLQFCLETIPEF
jgi:aspartate carbamoyltransferase catalytic subunit